MKDFLASLKGGINSFIKSETDGPDAKVNLIFGILLVIIAIAMFVPSVIVEVINAIKGTESNQSSFERIIIILFVVFYFGWCVTKLGKINEEKEKLLKLKK